jgi:hypothetical protein
LGDHEAEHRVDDLRPRPRRQPAEDDPLGGYVAIEGAGDRERVEWQGSHRHSKSSICHSSRQWIWGVSPSKVMGNHT